MAEHKRHHFVPQFYLRNFATDPSKRRIGLFHLQKTIYVPETSIRSQAQRSKLYGDNGGEQALCELEGAASRIISQAIEQHRLPEAGSTEHFHLLLFLLFQAFRTPAAAADLQDAANQMCKLIASRDSRFAPYVSQVDFEWTNPVHLTLRCAAENHPVMMDLPTKLLVSRSGVPFLTSDHPVVFYNQFMEKRHKFGSGTGLAAKGLEVFLPLSPRAVLLLYDPAVYRIGGRSITPCAVPLHEADVFALNVLQAVNAEEQLFFDNTISELHLRKVVDAAGPHRRNSRSLVRAYPGRPERDSARSEFIHMSKQDIRIRLRLSAVAELPSAQGYRLGSKVVHNRDSFFSQVHDEFLKRVDAKEYTPSEFHRFLQEHHPVTDPSAP